MKFITKILFMVCIGVIKWWSKKYYNSDIVIVATPIQLNEDTKKLIGDFGSAMAIKLREAEIKHGYLNNWKRPDWKWDCVKEFYDHIFKGDPIDIANYCAFMWFHKWRTLYEGKLGNYLFTKTSININREA